MYGTQGQPVGASPEWDFYIDGLEKINLIHGPLGHEQIQLTLSSHEKADALVSMCQFTESNPEYRQFGFGRNLAEREVNLILWGGDDKYQDLLNVLKRATGEDASLRPFHYSLIKA